MRLGTCGEIYRENEEDSFLNIECNKKILKKIEFSQETLKQNFEILQILDGDWKI